MSERKVSRKRRLPRLLTRILKLSPIWIASAAIVLFAVELSYRNGWFDPYRPELQRYNSRAMLQDSERPTVLCMGDSLTAGERSWPAFLRLERPDLRVINGGLPGTGIVQASLIAPRRLEEFKPDVLVYQINVANDLLNLRYPLNWSELSLARNVYWSISQRLRSVEFLNYRAGQAAFAFRNRHATFEPAPLDEPGCDWPVEPFTPERFTPRVREYLRANPWLIDEQIQLGGERAADHERLLEGLDALLQLCRAPECKAVVMVVPHPVQIEPGLQPNYEALGARFSSTDLLHSKSYPFLDGIRERLAQHPGVLLVDPLAELRQLARAGQHICFRDDEHLNDCGQALMAREVARALTR